MNTLDDPKVYHQLDQSDLYGSLTKFSRQIESGWHSAQFFTLDYDLDKIKNIVLVGMGGSNSAGKILDSLSPFLFLIPFEVIANYRLPAYADKNTLVILSSYSGETEEVLSAAQDAKLRACKVLCLTTGGKLKDLAKSDNLPIIELDGKLNPSLAPRAGLALSLGALLCLVLRLNPSAVRFLNEKEIIRTIDRVLDMVSNLKTQVDNPAKTLAAKHRNLGVIFLTANHLVGVAQTACNFVNETAKTFSASYNFPDLNHHLLEGFNFPTSLKDSVNIIILNSHLYPEVIQKRIQVTREILLKQKYHVTLIKPETNDPVSQVFESLVFLIMFSYYLSIANKVNPTPNPWVDYLKSALKN